MLRYNPDGSMCSWEYSPEETRVQLCRLIARLDLTLNFGESAAFEDYIKIAHNPRYSTVSRQTPTRDVEKYFKDKHAKLVGRLQSVSCVALTSDIWSGNAKEDYFSVVAHFVNGVNIAKRIADVVAEYGLTDKIFSITLDNASANSKAMETLSPSQSGYVDPLPPRPEGPLLTDDHWHVGEKILEFLKRFYDSTVVIFGVYYPISPLMLHHILCIIRHLNLYENNRLLRTVIVPMKDKFLKYWSEIPMLYAFAFILDPRAKMRGFNNVLCLLFGLTGRDYSAYLTTVRAKLSDLFKKYDDKFGAVRLQRPSNAAPGEGRSKYAWDLVFGAGPDSSGANSIGLGGGPGLGASSMGLGTGLGAAASSMGLANTPAGIFGTELASYLDSDTVQKFDDDFNILDYWHDHKIIYLVLSILAKDVLSVLISTVSLESAFSLVSRVTEERRRRLLPSMVEMLSLVKDWEAGDARMQHTAEDKALTESFEQLFLDDPA
ncbi:hypothetical protein U9M48_034932 [Paspalum notatum var. saurae]|uniref:Transposase n=1 Tax=Paspalum notatum var. saurae TaxID=547442 RepID=A0AAQ3X8D6_PASNO